MGKFNTSVKNVQSKSNMVNAAGGAAFALNEKTDLALTVLSAMLKNDQFYASDSTIQKDIVEKMEKVQDTNFLAKLLVFTRTIANLRSVSHLLAVELAARVKGDNIVRKAITKAIVRPDDMVEMLSYWNAVYSGMVPNSLRRAFKDALETKFGHYQLKKYAKATSKVKLKDVVKLAHPQPKDVEHSKVLKQLIEDKLPAINTLETRRAAGETTSVTFADLVSQCKLGYMVAIKNLAKVVEEDSLTMDQVDSICSLIKNKEAMRKSRTLPYQLALSAQAVYHASKYGNSKVANKFLAALDAALINSADIFNEIDAKIALVLDESGSMTAQAIPSPFDIGLSMVAAASQSTNCKVFGFATEARYFPVKHTPVSTVLECHASCGATYFHTPLELMIKDNIEVDYVIIFTDMQLYSSGYVNSSFIDYWKEYKKRVSSNAKLLFWNLSGKVQGAPVFEDTDKVFISGFSDAMFDVALSLLNSSDGLVKQIEAVEI